MTDSPDRTIGGLAPRTSAAQPDLSRLQRRNRQPAPLSPVPSAPERGSITPLTRPAKSAPPEAVAAVEPAPTGTDVPAHTAAQDRITVYLDRRLRERARTAYRATAHLEGDRTWSDFVERAIRAEVERRERAHNDDQPYSTSAVRLPPGRTIS